jgi:4-amino-4-deoxy-L-arabinose transferase-like glycosyltransferase
MNSLQKFSLRWGWIIIVSMIALAVVYSALTLTTRPRIWIDEAKSIELARNFLESGHLDIQTAPGQFSGVSPLLQSTGYPVTFPLVLFFKIFGYGFFQARIFMVVWMVLALFMLAYLGLRIFAVEKAVWTVALLVTFPSFYDNGRTVVGEIPGFLFLLAGLSFWLLSEKKYRFFVAGILWGLAIVTKPSVFLLMIPALVVACIVERKEWFGRLFQTALGMIPAVIAWVFIVLPKPFATETWSSIATFYKNPYSSSVSQNVVANLLGTFHNPTLIYFGFFGILLVYVWPKISDLRIKFLYTFTLTYSFFAYVYYLRSPGWLRYIIIAELLILFLLPDLFSRLFGNKRVFSAEKAIFAVALFQLIYLATGAKLYTSDAAIRTAHYIDSHYPRASVGTLNTLEVSTLLATRDRHAVAFFTGIPEIGTNPALLREPPDIIVTQGGGSYFNDAKTVLINKYEKVATFGQYQVFDRVD